MFIHFKGQGRSVSVNMAEVKEIDCSLQDKSDNPTIFAIRLVMVYPTITGSFPEVVTDEEGYVSNKQQSVVSGMHHFDFKFRTREERSECMSAIAGSLCSRSDWKGISLPDLV